jgi:hypothetical protein
MSYTAPPPPVQERCRRVFRSDPLLPYRGLKNNAPATNLFSNSSTISTGEFPEKRGSSVPLNLLGGHRWAEADTPVRTAKTSTVIDVEIGRGGTAVVSPDGVMVSIVPSRHY